MHTLLFWGLGVEFDFYFCLSVCIGNTSYLVLCTLIQFYLLCQMNPNNTITTLYRVTKKERLPRSKEFLTTREPFFFCHPVVSALSK